LDAKPNKTKYNKAMDKKEIIILPIKLLLRDTVNGAVIWEKANHKRYKARISDYVFTIVFNELFKDHYCVLYMSRGTREETVLNAVEPEDKDSFELLYLLNNVAEIQCKEKVCKVQKVIESIEQL
jgi:hypothetical protein